MQPVASALFAHRIQQPNRLTKKKKNTESLATVLHENIVHETCAFGVSNPKRLNRARMMLIVRD
jgi:hypothetical protein